MHNIENHVIHNCKEICITSKTMLYTIVTNVYNIENDVIHNYMHTSIVTNVYKIENDV